MQAAGLAVPQQAVGSGHGVARDDTPQERSRAARPFAAGGERKEAVLDVQGDVGRQAAAATVRDHEVHGGRRSSAEDAPRWQTQGENGQTRAQVVDAGVGQRALDRVVVGHAGVPLRPDVRQAGQEVDVDVRCDLREGRPAQVPGTVCGGLQL